MERERERESRFSERERDLDLDFDVSRWLNNKFACKFYFKTINVDNSYFERERERDLFAGDFDFERAPPRDLERLRDFERLRDDRADL